MAYFGPWGLESACTLFPLGCGLEGLTPAYSEGKGNLLQNLDPGLFGSPRSLFLIAAVPAGHPLRHSRDTDLERWLASRNVLGAPNKRGRGGHGVPDRTCGLQESRTPGGEGPPGPLPTQRRQDLMLPPRTVFLLYNIRLSEVLLEC